MRNEKRHFSTVEIINMTLKLLMQTVITPKKKAQLKIYISKFKLKFMGKWHLKGCVQVILLIPKTGGERPLTLIIMAKLIKTGN